MHGSQHIEEGRLQAFLGQIVADLGGANSVAMVKLGDRLGRYRSLHRDGPATPVELAQRTGCAVRYLAEWLAHQAASNYVSYDPSSGRFTLPAEQALVFAEERSPVYMIGGFESVIGMIENEPNVAEAFRNGGGIAWGEQAGCMFCAVAKFFRPGYEHNLVQSWLPSLSGVVEKLQRGAIVADIGCGHGHSTLIMARAFPASTFIGFDFHAESIEAANRHRDEQGLSSARVRSEVASAKDFGGERYDLITSFDSFHDMGDPVGAAAHALERLDDDGSWMVVEPMAGDSLVENLNLIGRLFYAGSSMICVPTSLAQETGAALGSQAGMKALSAVIGTGGFKDVRRAAATPFNLVIEARKHARG